MIDQLINIFVKTIETGGYVGVAFLMTLESMIVPVPSEAVMPFAGFLWLAGKMSFWPIVIYATIGSIIGSLISYYMGFYGGRPVIKKCGKYCLLNEGHLLKTENFFEKFGGGAVFIGRFIPIVRHLISIPAGAGKMNIFKFIFYTAVGAGLWNSFLTYLGYYLGSNWMSLRKYSETIDIVLIVVIFIFVVLWFHKRSLKINPKP